MEEVNEPHGQEQTETSEGAIINIGNDPVMQSLLLMFYQHSGFKGKVGSEEHEEMEFQMPLQLQISSLKK